MYHPANDMLCADDGNCFFVKLLFINKKVILKNNHSLTVEKLAEISKIINTNLKCHNISLNINILQTIPKSN